MLLAIKQQGVPMEVVKLPVACLVCPVLHMVNQPVVWTVHGTVDLV